MKRPKQSTPQGESRKQSREAPPASNQSHAEKVAKAFVENLNKQTARRQRS